MSTVMEQAIKLWLDAREILKDEPGISQETYEQWFQSVKPISLCDNNITLGVSDDFFGDILINNYGDLIQSALQTAHGAPVSIDLEYGHSAEKDETINPISEEKKIEIQQEAIRTEQSKTRFAQNCHPEHTFDSYVVGEESQFAYAAAVTASKTPGIYNPLFIYGGTGLGKTHMLQAVAHEYLRHYPDHVVEYIPCETLVNHYVDSLRQMKHWEFRNKFRAVDMLLVDDIQFLSKGKQIQEEFFNTFNTLYNEGKQIILASDRPPAEINGLEDRLVSRFEFGVTTEIIPPTVETRLAILRKKQEKHLIKISDEVLYFIANRITSNIRRLEGALLRLVAYSSAMSNCTISVDLAEKLLGQLFDQEAATRKVSIEAIQKAVSSHYDIKMSEILGSRRPKNIANPRMIAMYLSRNLTEHSLPEIGSAFGGRNHATVINAIKKVESMCDKDEDVRRSVSALKRQIQGQ